MKSDVEAIKNQVMRVVEAHKNAADEIGQLACLWLDYLDTQFVSCHSLQNERDSLALPANSDDEFLDVKQLEVRIGIKKSTLYAWNSSGKIKGHKFGGSLRFSWREVSEWAKQTNHPTTIKRRAMSNKA